MGGMCEFGGGRIVCGGGCIDPRVTGENCGMCGRSCGPGGACVGGMCTCATGFTNCGGSCVDLNASAANCSACGMACPTGQICAAGMCRVGSYSGYTESTSTTAFMDACTLSGHTSALPSTDDGTATATIPWSVIFYNAMTSTVWFSSNGVVGFGTANTSFSNACLPTTTFSGPVITAFWDDLLTRTSGVCTATVGTAPNRQFIITTSDASPLVSTTSHLNFSVVIYESSNLVEIVYGMMSGTGADGSSATIGVQNGTVSTQHSCDTAGTLSNTALRYTPM
jgi:hypothetical protein